MRKSKIKRPTPDSQQQNQQGGFCVSKFTFHFCSKDPQPPDIEKQMKNIQVRKDVCDKSPKLAAANIRSFK